MNRLRLATALAAIATTAAPLVGTAQAQAQDIEGPRVAPDSTLLSINAVGKTSGKPDLAMFTAGVATTGKTAGEALSANSAAMNRVISALKAAGIADKDIQTSNLSINPVYADNNAPRPVQTLEDQTPRIIGYRAGNQVIVKQRNLKEFGKVIDTLVSAGANEVNGPNFQVTNEDTALDTARRDAITQARARAQLYATAAGLKVRRIVSISEGSSYRPSPQVAYARVAMDKAESTPVEAGEVELQVNVSVLFELAP